MSIWFNTMMKLQFWVSLSSLGSMQNYVGHVEWSNQSSLHFWEAIQVCVSHKPSWFLCRRYNLIFHKLRDSGPNEISQTTGCMKPCKYRKYSFLGKSYLSALKLDQFLFSLWANVATEELIFPISSLVAEFGGTLSLFLGFSFISLWDTLTTLRKYCGAK